MTLNPELERVLKDFPGIVEMLRERVSQQREHGYTPEFDLQHQEGALAALAMWFLIDHELLVAGVDQDTMIKTDVEIDAAETFLAPFGWGGLRVGVHPTGEAAKWLKKWIEQRKSKTYQERLIIAGALLAAEYENNLRREQDGELE